MTKRVERNTSCQEQAAISALYMNTIQPYEPRLDTGPVFGIIAKVWEGISGAEYELWRLELNSI